MPDQKCASDRETLEQMRDDLAEIRGRFGRIQEPVDGGDDYRQAKIDVAVDCIEEIEEMLAEYERAGMWPED